MEVYLEDHLYRVPCQFRNKNFDQEWNNGRQIIVGDLFMIMHSHARTMR